MDQFTRSIIGFAVHHGDVDGATLCRMFNKVISQKEPPRYLSSDNDPFVERLIGSVRRELLDQTFFWNENDLAKRLAAYQNYYNCFRTHSALDGQTPISVTVKTLNSVINLKNYRWQPHCRVLFHIPAAA